MACPCGSRAGPARGAGSTPRPCIFWAGAAWDACSPTPRRSPSSCRAACVGSGRTACQAPAQDATPQFRAAPRREPIEEADRHATGRRHRHQPPHGGGVLDISAVVPVRAQHDGVAPERCHPRNPEPRHGRDRHRSRHRPLDGRALGCALGAAAPTRSERTFAAARIGRRARARTRFWSSQWLFDRLRRDLTTLHDLGHGHLSRRHGPGHAVSPGRCAMGPATQVH